MPSPTVPCTTSPIARLPYEILREIFTHCLSQYPLQRRQPSTKIAPILLCHVCSTWRRIALASATLWAHLSYSFTRVTCVKMHSTSGSAFWAAEFPERDIEFIRWWKVNQGQVAPFLNFRLNLLYHARQKSAKSNSDSAFLLDYITSTQHLDLYYFFWSWLLTEHQTGRPLFFPYLHTALTTYTSDGNAPLNELQMLFLPQNVPVLRRLSFSDFHVPSNDYTPPIFWAALTHISLCYPLPLPAWQSVIRALPRLQWGHFNIPSEQPLRITHETPPQFILRELSTLSIVICCNLAQGDAFLPSALFTALHLPALRNLSLSAPGAKPWKDGRALSDLYTILASTPGITKLAIQDQHLFWDTHEDSPPTPPPTIQAIHPIWHYTLHLEHIQLVLPGPRGPTSRDVERNQMFALFIRHVFSEWLDLRNPASPVCKITIIDNKALHQTSEAMASIRECTTELPRVVLEFTESAELDDPDLQKEWSTSV